MMKKVFISAISTFTILSASSVYAGSEASTKAQYAADKETCRYLVNQRKQAIRDKAAQPQKELKTTLAVAESKTLSNKSRLSDKNVPERVLKRADIYDSSTAVTDALANKANTSLNKKQTFKYKLVSECMKDKGYV